MKHWKLVDTIDQTTTFVVTEDDQTPANSGYDDDRFDWTEHVEPDELDGVLADVEEDPVKAGEFAKQEILRQALEQLGKAEEDPVHQQRLWRMWTEVQRLKLAHAGGLIPELVGEQQRQYPMIMALSALSGVPPLEVAQVIETDYWERIKRMALVDAKAILALHAVRDGATAEEKIMATGVSW